VADSGFEVERVRFDKWLPLAEGFAQAAKYIRAGGRPLTSFCACELRSPAASPRMDFEPSTSITSRRSRSGDCSTHHQSSGAQQCLSGDRSAIRAVLYAFSFTRPSQNAMASFVIAGGAELRGGSGSYPERIVRYAISARKASRRR